MPGVWLAGNVTDLRAQVIHAAGAGLVTAAAVNGDLIAEGTRLAVEEYRRLEQRGFPAGRTGGTMASS